VIGQLLVNCKQNESHRFVVVGIYGGFYPHA
jgi:hypothetical protein